MLSAKSEIPTAQTGMYKAQLTAHPAQEHLRPYRNDVRMCFADFFPMFEVPFRYGSGWSRGADRVPEQVVGRGDETNLRPFPGVPRQPTTAT